MRRSVMAGAAFVVALLASASLADGQTNDPPVSPIQTTGNPDTKVRALVLADGAPLTGLSIAWYEVDPVRRNRLRVHPVDSGSLERPGNAIEVYVGDPGGDQARTVVTFGGSETQARLEKRRGQDWQHLGPAAVSLEPNGDLMIERPEPPGGVNTYTWIKTTSQEGSQSLMPLVRQTSLDQPRRDTLQSSDRGWAYRDSDVIGDRTAPPGPTVSWTPSMLSYSFDAAPPRELNGVAVTGVQDRVHLRLTSDLNQPAPFDLVLDELNRELTLRSPPLDEPVPTTLTAGVGGSLFGSTTMISGPFRDKIVAVDEGTRVEVQRLTLESAMGAPLGPGSTINMTREISLANGERIVQASVAQAPSGASAAVSQSTPGTGTIPGQKPPPKPGRGVSRRLLAVIAVVGAMISGVVFLVWGRRTMWWKEARAKRRVRKRRAARDRDRSTTTGT